MPTLPGLKGCSSMCVPGGCLTMVRPHHRVLCMIWYFESRYCGGCAFLLSLCHLVRGIMRSQLFMLHLAISCHLLSHKPLRNHFSPLFSNKSALSGSISNALSNLTFLSLQTSSLLGPVLYFSSLLLYHSCINSAFDSSDLFFVRMQNQNSAQCILQSFSSP